MQLAFQNINFILLKIIIGFLFLIYLSYNHKTKKMSKSFFIEEHPTLSIFTILPKFFLFCFILLPFYFYFGAKTPEKAIFKALILTFLFCILFCYDYSLVIYFIKSFFGSYFGGRAYLYRNKNIAENDLFICFFIQDSKYINQIVGFFLITLLLVYSIRVHDVFLSTKIAGDFAVDEYFRKSSPLPYMELYKTKLNELESKFFFQRFFLYFKLFFYIKLFFLLCLIVIFFILVYYCV